MNSDQTQFSPDQYLSIVMRYELSNKATQAHCASIDKVTKQRSINS